MSKILIGCVVSLPLLPAIAAPAAAQNREHQQLAAELRQLQEQNQLLGLALARLAEALDTVTARLDKNERFQQQRFADQETLVKNLGSELSTVRERAQDSDRRLRSLSDEIDALRQTFLSLPSLIAQAQAAAAAAAAAADPNAAVDPSAPPQAGVPPPAPLPPAASLPLPPTAGLSPNRMFETAWSDYTAGQYSLAITGFGQLVETFPLSERTDNAQYLIGESLYNLNRFAEAAEAYNRVILNYPTGDQVDMAYYKRGLAQERAGNPDAARMTWEEVVTRYPDSQGANFAKQSLVRLSRQSAPDSPLQ